MLMKLATCGKSRPKVGLLVVTENDLDQANGECNGEVSDGGEADEFEPEDECLAVVHGESASS